MLCYYFYTFYFAVCHKNQNLSDALAMKYDKPYYLFATEKNTYFSPFRCSTPFPPHLLLPQHSTFLSLFRSVSVALPGLFTFSYYSPYPTYTCPPHIPFTPIIIVPFSFLPLASVLLEWSTFSFSQKQKRINNGIHGILSLVCQKCVRTH